MRTLVVALVLSAWMATPAAARDWKVRPVTDDPKSAGVSVTLAISTKTGIRVVRAAPQTTLTIAPKDVAAIWYDDKLVNESLGREWWNRMESTCREICGEGDLTTPLVLMALGGAGYLAVEPFSDRQHFVNIRYRTADRIEWLTLRTNWLDHFWLMTDLSQATGLRWLNMPLQRAKLFWSLGDHSYSFQTWWATEAAEVTGGDYDVLLWEDGKGHGVLMVFTKGRGETPRTVAAEAIVVEGPDREDEFPEYCRGEDGLRRLLRISIKHKRLVLPAWDAACRRAQERRDVPQ